MQMLERVHENIIKVMFKKLSQNIEEIFKRPQKEYKNIQHPTI